MATEAEMRATARYKKANIRRISFEVQNTYWDEVLKPAIVSTGMSTNGFIKMCIEKYLREEMGITGAQRYMIELSGTDLDLLNPLAERMNESVEEFIMNAVAERIEKLTIKFHNQ